MTRGPTSMRDWCASMRHPCHVHRVALLSIAQPTSVLISTALFASYVTSGWLIGARNSSPRQTCVAYYACAMFVWAASVVFATASYHAYTYQLNCAHRSDACVDERGEPRYAMHGNGVAAAYLVLQMVGHHLLVVGDAYRVARRRVPLVKRACVGTVVAFVLVVCASASFATALAGYLFAINLAMMAPSFAAQVWWNARTRYAPRLLMCWCILALSIAVYGAILPFDDPRARWELTGVWFDANDALHLVLLAYGPALLWASSTAVDDADAAA